MKRFLILPMMLGVLALASCASLPSQTTITQAKAAYGAVLAVALGYARSCQRKLLPPSCWDTVDIIKRVDDGAQRAIAAADVLALVAATTNLKQVNAEKGVQ